MEATLSVKGQLTLPKPLRDMWNLKTGDKVIFEETDEGEFIVRPRAADVFSLKGCVAYKGVPVSIEDMDQAIAENVRSDV